MRVAWDLQAVTGPQPTGLGRFVKLLHDALAAQPGPVESVGLRPNQRGAPLRGTLDRLYWEQLALPRAARRFHARQRLDLLYTPALGAPRRCVVPVVAHVNDVIPLTHPGQFTGLSRWYWEQYLPDTWRRCRLLTTSNEAVRHEIAHLLPYPAERVRVVPLYPDAQLAQLVSHYRSAQAAAGSGSERQPPLFLTLGIHEPRKNLGLPIRALAVLKQRGLPARLTCVGRQTPHTDQLRKLALAAGLQDAVTFPGYLAQDGIARLLASCTALLFVSRLEGYGMPPQEAQGAGCPVVLSEIACLRAVYDDPQRWAQVAQELREPPAFIGLDDVDALAAVMLRLIEDAAYRERLCRSGLAYQATFGPQGTAAALVSAFAAAAQSGG